VSRKYRAILSVDPGIQKSGWAIFVDNLLTACGVARFQISIKNDKLFKEDTKRLLAIRQITAKIAAAWEQVMGVMVQPNKMIIEQPEIYNHASRKGDPNDLMPLAILGGVLWERMAPNQIIFVKPKLWKGQVPKEVMTKRTHAELSQREQNIAIDSFRDLPKDAYHDGYDAIGIGRWYIKKESK